MGLEKSFRFPDILWCDESSKPLILNENAPLLPQRGGYASHAAADEGDPKQGGSVQTLGGGTPGSLIM